MRFLKWLIGIVITIGILLAVAPLAAKWYLVRWLQDQGYQVEIKKLGIDFIFGELHLQGVNLTSPQRERFALFDARLDFDILALRDHRVVVDKLTVDSAQLDVTRSADGLRVAGFPLHQVLNQLGGDWPLEVRSAALLNTDICRAAQQCLRMESVVFSRARWQRAGSSWSFIHNAPLQIEKMFLRDQSSNTTLFYGAALSIGRGSYTPGFASLENLVLTNFQFVENSLGDAAAETPYQTQLGEMKITSVIGRSGSDAQVVLGLVDITSLRQSLHRNGEGALVLPARLHQLLDETALAQAPLVLEGLEMRDGTVSWVDHSVAPPALVNASGLNLQLGRLDGSQPETATPVRLAGKLAARGALQIEGEIYPFAPQTRFTLAGFVKSLDMTKLAGYSRALLGQVVDQGEIDVSFSAAARNNRVDANSRWRLTNLRVEPTRGKSPHMPLELSYDLLKDHNNSVAFELAVRGELGSDQLQPRQVFGTQIRRTLSEMAGRRVGPAGAVRVPPRAAAGGELAFRPLAYPVNGREPAGAERARLQELAEMLREKPHLSMVFCPVTTGGEWAELFNQSTPGNAATSLPPDQKQALLDLAAARGRALRSALIDAGAAAEQVVICSPSIDMTQAGLSFVSISL